MRAGRAMAMVPRDGCLEARLVIVRRGGKSSVVSSSMTSSASSWVTMADDASVAIDDRQRQHVVAPDLAGDLLLDRHRPRRRACWSP